MDLVFAVGRYNLVSMAANTLGVERDRGCPRVSRRVTGGAVSSNAAARSSNANINLTVDIV